MMQNNFFSLLSGVFSALSSLHRVSLVHGRENMVHKNEIWLYGRFAIQKGFMRLSLE